MSHRTFIHCDCDYYFAAIEKRDNPTLENIPFAVCGDPEMRHSIVMSKNSLAKKAGVPTGISFRQARQICPDLHYVKADMGKYLKETNAIRNIFHKYSGTIIPYGMDEAWIDLGPVPYKVGVQIAELIRIEIKYALGLSASLGVSFNYIFSKIGSDYRKPNAVTVITHDNYKDIVWALPASDLLFVGSRRKRLLQCAGIQTIGDIARADPLLLGQLLGKVGNDLYCYANGDDSSFKPANDSINSIGNTLTPPADLRSSEDVSAILYLLATTVCARLKKHGLKTSCISIHMRDNAFNKIIRQCSFKISTDNVNYVFNQAYALFSKHYKWKRPLRSIGLRAEGLDKLEQLTLYPYDECKLSVDVDSRIKQLTRKYGALKVEESATTKDWWPCVEGIPY